MPNEPKSMPSVAAAREAERDRRTQLPAGCAIDEREIGVPGGVLRLRSYRPERAGEQQRAGLVFFHGGAFVVGDPASHDALCGGLSLEADCVVVSSAYRLAPEHRFPSAVDDAYFAASFVHEHADEFGIDHRRLGVAGVEVGAGLATTVARLAKERRNPALGFQALLRPWLDLREADWAIEQYADARVREDPRCSPLLARNLIGLPPVLIAGGETDVRVAQANAYAERLREVHVAVERCGDPSEADGLRACARAIRLALASEK